MKPESGVAVADIEQAKQAHRAGELRTAEAIYERVLADNPRDIDGLHFFGLLRHHQQRDDEAVRLITEALCLQPEYVDAHVNLGNIHKLAGRLDEAANCYARALALQPKHPAALQNAAVVLEARGDVEMAKRLHLGLIREFPDSPGFRARCADFLMRFASTDGDVGILVECLHWLVERDPADGSAWRRLGVVYYSSGRPELAAGIYREWVKAEPENPIARHLLAASGGGVAPARADDEYIRRTFDQFAGSFDERLLNQLSYVAPRKLVDALASGLGEPRAALDVLDAGCGTGLCGPLLRPYAARLIGIDLSPAMIERAAPRGYDQLEVAELTAFLRSAPGAWDLVVSADTLVYFGDLGEVLVAAAAALRPGGWLGFTLEALPGEADRVVLDASGRYQHSRAQVEARLATAGLQLVALLEESLRTELGRPVPGLVVVARRP